MRKRTSHFVAFALSVLASIVATIILKISLKDDTYSVYAAFSIFFTIYGAYSAGAFFKNKIWWRLKFSEAAQIAGLFYFRPVKKIGDQYDEDAILEIFNKIAKEIKCAPISTRVEILVSTGFRTFSSASPIRKALEETEGLDVKVFIMCSDPTSPVFRSRMVATHLSEEDLSGSIQKTIDFLEDMRKLKKLNYYHYYSSPIWRLFRVGNTMFSQYCERDRPSFASIAYGFKANGADDPNNPSSLFDPFASYINNLMLCELVCNRNSVREVVVDSKVTLKSLGHSFKGQLLNVSQNKAGVSIKIDVQCIPNRFDIRDLMVSIPKRNIRNSKCDVRWTRSTDSHLILGGRI